MIEVSILTAHGEPIGEGLVFQLAARGKVLAEATTDQAGVAAFDLDAGRRRSISLRHVPPAQEE
ncbi:hypothetical protein OJ997_00655 [Solirubrobacter phytolaccae]|uniref:Uncharacterized protein n=1 Tax=Solirubrobacter phytolaccae TaxID=1404360 RepID=A0A9X3S684_9ACTN|nr:hypothetical protein [Solirubrobacter phytolaccae]MDA0178788.1 hypothetical protein [Solirubrobacter phytolaccae]